MSYVMSLHVKIERLERENKRLRKQLEEAKK
jgi:hypothetical protein